MLHFLFFFFYLLNVANGGFLPMPSPASTIPAFPEQSAVSACPLNLPDALFPSVAGSCSPPVAGCRPGAAAARRWWRGSTRPTRRAGVRRHAPAAGRHRDLRVGAGQGHGGQEGGAAPAQLHLRPRLLLLRHPPPPLHLPRRRRHQSPPKLGAPLQIRQQWRRVQQVPPSSVPGESFDPFFFKIGFLV